MGTKAQKLVLAYNAEGGLLNALTDSVKKVLSKDDYECSLCAVTHGMVSMRYEWRKFLGGLPHDKAFYHRDDLPARYVEAGIMLPVIMLDDGETTPTTLINSQELAQINDLSQLMDLLKQRLSGA